MTQFVINHLWQSSCFVLVAELLAFVLRGNSPKIRYWVWLSASLKFVIPFALLVSLGGMVPRPARHAVSIPEPVFPDAFVQGAEPFSPAPPVTVPAHTSLHRVPVAIGAVWALGFLAVVLARCRSWLRVRTRLRAGTPIDLPIAIRALVTPGVEELGIVGFVRPVLILPAQLLEELNPRQLDAILIHELCHVRRRDNFFAAVHMVVEAIFWFHPLVWWIGSRMLKERELACDEEVLRMGCEPADYVEGILKVCCFYTESSLPCISGVTGADVKKRLRAILAGRVARELNAGKKAMLAAIGLAALAVPVLIGVVNAPVIVAQVPAVGGTVPSNPVQATNSQEQSRFEMADVHVSTTVHGAAQNVGGILREGRYINRDATMLQLIEAAWGVPEDTISGGPSWVSLDLFDVVAKVPSGTTPSAAHLMLQNLLADRFGLVIKQGSHPVPRYVLSVVKGGSKLKSSTGSGDPGCQPVQQTAPPNSADPASIPNIKVQCRNVTAAAIAENLHRMAGGYIDHDLIDSTGLNGLYDFDLEWTDRPLLAVHGADGISLFTAVEKQLGLKLEVRNVSVPSFVIEKVNRRPSPNPADIEATLTTAAAQFEAASIKLADPAKPFTGVYYAGGTEMHAGGTLRQLIATALLIPPDVAADTVIGLPKSADDVRWDIVAKMPETGEGAPRLVQGQRRPPPFSVVVEMLRRLLVESFEMKTHIENREVTVYVLTVAGKKSKMTRADEAERSLCKPDNNAPKPSSAPMKVMSCKNTTMEEFAVRLPQWAGLYIDHPIVEGTGLLGGWDFVLGWTPKSMMPAVPLPGANITPGEIAAPGGITVFEAIKEELGLTLAKQKRSIPVIVIDHVDEQPLE